MGARHTKFYKTGNCRICTSCVRLWLSSHSSSSSQFVFLTSPDTLQMGPNKTGSGPDTAICAHHPITPSPTILYHIEQKSTCLDSLSSLSGGTFCRAGISTGTVPITQSVTHYPITTSPSSLATLPCRHQHRHCAHHPGHQVHTAQHRRDSCELQRFAGEVLQS